MKHVIRSMSELPQIPESIEYLYLDVETTTSTRTIQREEKEGLYPYYGDRICGYAFTFDKCEDAWYVPVRHSVLKGAKNPNVDLASALAYVQRLLKASKRWVNHNNKFDAHFFHVDGVSFGEMEMHDSAVLAKLINSDRFNHKLKILCREWVGMEMPEEHRVAAYLKSIKSEDYGRVPPDMLGDYACQDVIGNRELYWWCMERLPEESKTLWETETRVTSVLFDMEAEGMTVDLTMCRIEGVKAMRSMIQSAETVREHVNIDLVDSNDCFHEILVTQFGLPVLRRTGPGGLTGNPSFDKEAMEMYMGHPEVLYDEKKRKVLEAMMTYRREDRFNSLFVQSFLKKADAKNMVHPNYNQLVRTGRMSCSDPNAQQLSPRAKLLIVPQPGEALACQDASQIEFRLIIHYTKNEKALAAYAADPWTDFHTFVAEMCQTKRKPAKTLNFTMAYGAGRTTVTRKLSMNPDVMERVSAIIDQEVATGKLHESSRPQRYSQLCRKSASEIYERYHHEFPEIKELAENTTTLVRSRGYVRNAYGRRRHLPSDHAHKGFNSAVQGCAMDIIKERMVALAPRYNPWTRSLNVRQIINVHDELVQTGPKEVIMDPSYSEKAIAVLEDVQYPFRVPIKWDGGVSDKNWKEAKGD